MAASETERANRSPKANIASLPEMGGREAMARSTALDLIPDGLQPLC
jgi:hypothetical protein